jgi:hypothetical protein
MSHSSRATSRSVAHTRTDRAQKQLVLSPRGPTQTGAVAPPRPPHQRREYCTARSGRTRRMAPRRRAGRGAGQRGIQTYSARFFLLASRSLRRLSSTHARASCSPLTRAVVCGLSADFCGLLQDVYRNRQRAFMSRQKKNDF